MQVAPLEKDVLVAVAPPSARTTLRRRTIRLASHSSKSKPARYSVRKFNDLDAYLHSASTWRVARVLLLLPLPGLLVAVIPPFLPLRPPAEGYNVAFFAHAACVEISAGIGIIYSVTADTDFPNELYSHHEMVAVTLISAALHNMSLYMTTRWWKYPIPFAWVLLMPGFIITLVLAHLAVLRRKLWQHREFADALRMYAATLILQTSQLLFYPAFSVAFDNATDSWRILLTLLFPVIKLVLKRMLHRVSLQLKDKSVAVAVGGVEICASLYQSMILQTTPSPFTTCIIIGIDVIQGAIAIKWFLDQHARVQVSTLSGVSLLDAARFLVNRHRLESTKDLATQVEEDRDAPVTVQLRGRRNSVLTRKEHELVLAHALETVQVAEEVLLMEYYEVMIPLVHSVVLLITGRLPTAQFNTRLAPFFHHPFSVLFAAVQSIWLYSGLQGVSLVVMHVVMQKRYGIPGFTLLAFVLERHRRSIHGKLFVWLPVILSFTLVQYGVDFLLQFDYS